MIGGVVLALVAAFLPWLTASAPFMSVTKNGIESDGQITAGLAIVAGILVLAYLRALRRPLAVLIIVAALAALITFVGMIDFINVKDKIGDLTAEQRRLISASVGVGLYLTIAAGVTLLTGAVLGIATRD
jgi:hypothetical protein